MFFSIVFYDIKLSILGFFNFRFTKTPIYVKLFCYVTLYRDKQLINQESYEQVN